MNSVFKGLLVDDVPSSSGCGCNKVPLFEQHPVHIVTQEFRQVDEELQYNEVLIEERDEAIQEISQQIGEVHEIFQARRRLCSAHASCQQGMHNPNPASLQRSGAMKTC